MPKAGKYDFPNIDIDSVVQKLRQYHEIVKTDETKREVVAETLGMSVKGGHFTYLISSMEKYGLVQTGAGKVVVTKLGKAIVYGEPSEVGEAKKKAVSSVNLFREVYEQYGKDVTVEQIRAFLRGKANVDISKAQKLAEKVDTIYKKVSNYIVPAKKLEPPSKEPMLKVPSKGRGDIVVEPKPNKAELLKIQFGDFYIQVAKEDAKEALKLVAQKLGISMTEKKTD